MSVVGEGEIGRESQRVGPREEQKDDEIDDGDHDWNATRQNRSIFRRENGRDFHHGHRGMFHHFNRKIHGTTQRDDDEEQNNREGRHDIRGYRPIIAGRLGGDQIIGNLRSIPLRFGTFSIMESKVMFPQWNTSSPFSATTSNQSSSGTIPAW